MNCLVLAPQRLGIREVALRVGEEWEAMGHDVEYDLPDGAAARIGPVTVGIPGIAQWWRKRFKELAKDPTKYDLIWTHQPLSPTLPSTDPALWNRVVVTFHTTEHAEYRLARDGVYPRTRVPYLWVTRQLERWFYGRLSNLDAVGPRYTVVSSQLRDEIAAFGIEEAEHIPNGVFTPDDRDVEPIREAYGIPADATLVSNIGSHTAQKRPVVFARLLREAIEDDEELYCVMVGDGPRYEDVRAVASDCERLQTPGYVGDSEKWRLFASADVFASLSAYEGMPIATVEALSYGVPVVLSDIPAHRNVIEQYGATGTVVPDDPPAIRAAIERYRGQSAAVSLPNWHEIATSYLECVPALDGPSTLSRETGN